MAHAQTIAGSIVGTVRDPGKLGIPGADVTLVQTATGAARSMNTNDRGDFVFSNVLPGEYNLSARAEGFKTGERLAIMLSASETFPVGDIVLEVGSVTEAVTVTAEGTVVQTASSERAGVITSDQVENLLVRGRNVTDLLEILPGVVNLNDNESIERNWNLAINGGRRNTSGVSIDGMTTNDIGNNFNSAVSMGMDAVAEVKVLMTNYQAEYGRMSGANIQLVTKSGTRSFHGMGSYFKRHEQFNAMNYFDNRLGLKKSPYRYNTWSYNIGGPIYIPKTFNRNREKLFFFWSQEYWPIRAPQGAKQVTVPTEPQREGNFSQTIDLNGKPVQIKDPHSRLPVPGSIVPASQIDPNGQALLRVFPLPNYFDNSIAAYRYNYVFQSTKNSTQNMRTLKVDYNLNPNNVMFVNYSTHGDEQTGGMGLPDSGGTNWNQLVKTFSTHGSVLTGRYQRIFSPTLINELNVGLVRRPEGDIYSSDELQRNQRDAAGFNTGQFSPVSNPMGILPNANFGGVSMAAKLFVEGRFPLNQDESIFSITDSLTKIAGAHTIKGGIYVDRVWRNAAATGVAFNGTVNFNRNNNNPLDTNWAYANAMYGVFDSYTEASNRPYMHFRAGNIEWFLQDNWKVTRRLTLDYGMRFCLVPPLTERDRLVAGYVPSRFDPATQVKLIAPAMVGGKRVGLDPITGRTYPASAIGAIAPGSGDAANGMVVPARDSSYPAGLIDGRGIQFAPRIGLAFDPFGKGRTAIRTGFGMFYNRQDLTGVQQPYAVQTPLVDNPVVNFSELGGLLSSSGLLFPQDVLGLDRAGNIPGVMNFSFGVQQRVWFGTVLDASYVGSLGRHLMWQKNLNSIPFGSLFDPANADPTNPKVALSEAFLRPVTGYGDITMREWASSSNYHSLQLTANRRFSRGVQFGLSWTWSKALAYNSSDTDPVSTFVPVRVWNYGMPNFDRTHILKINWLWSLPRTPWRRGVANYVLNGWQMSGIASFISGTPLGVAYSTTGLTNITGSPTDGARIVVTGDPVLPKGERTFSRNFRTEVFRQPAKGTIGNAARTVIRGPGINNWNSAIFKTFTVREGVRFQFRCELYNAFNHTQFSALDTSPRFDAAGNQLNARFGESTAARNP
ncbi:MAG: carboxypeptidase regulatory-like domain-containing protein, partial [Acidobacteria bacterium]|nr:carboxypeptidase regulatory-like domain-containing protein [Acidobacteriota bacterium]